MPFRKLVSKEMSAMLKALAHPHRLLLIEELGDKELDVNSLQDILGIAHSNVSQHLAILRAHKIVSERREGRFVFYRLQHPELANWLLEGLRFLEEEHAASAHIRQAFDSAREAWQVVRHHDDEKSAGIQLNDKNGTIKS